MAHELVNEIRAHNARGEPTRAIIPCGPGCWYEPFVALVNAERISLRQLVVFHMDECLDWQGRELPRRHPYSFRGFMERHFYDPVCDDLAVPEANRYWLTPASMGVVAEAITAAPLDITLGGWGQDGHIAYNQARRHPFSQVTLNELRQSTIRVQDNNLDTILALAQRTFGRRLPVRAAHVGDARHQGVSLGAQSSAFQRYRRLETDGLARGVVRADDAGVPDHTPPGAS